MSHEKHAALVRIWKKKERRKSERAALIACVIANVNRGKNTQPLKIDDFIGEDDE